MAGKSKRKTPSKKTPVETLSQQNKKEGEQLKRKNPILITKPIVLGNFAVGIKKKDGDQTWCKWVCYVRGLTLDDDLSYISQITFHLHESFSPPQETITKAPFEVEKEGWGQFPLRIEIHFHESSGLQPLSLDYDLQLPAESQKKKKKPCVYEKYEELLFYDPTEKFEQLLRENTEQVQNSVKKIKLSTEMELKNADLSESEQEVSPLTSKKPSEDISSAPSNSTTTNRLSIASMIEQYATIIKEENSLKALNELSEKLKEKIKEKEDPSFIKTESSRTKTKKSKKQTKKESSDEDDSDYVD
ncbi:YEATS domain-containing protein [Naegleria gruberi]|uniref:YEATS domain-containing protein n=1 Tax=Naegleria gruberi TaxID=5762 RepID=D2UZT3_NAEGR|nr:YEATS domain-containing protein [Naegleria gruberi]EFC49989.1 YEATS domain-containing protein [Naegleria gruberi]|eukprot:XP_002682733.1 YEATS domain-containing protein [Naegleria gruberi strain NEG-M]